MPPRRCSPARRAPGRDAVLRSRGRASLPRRRAGPGRRAGRAERLLRASARVAEHLRHRRPRLNKIVHNLQEKRILVTLFLSLLINLQSAKRATCIQELLQQIVREQSQDTRNTVIAMVKGELVVQNSAPELLLARLQWLQGLVRPTKFQRADGQSVRELLRRIGFERDVTAFAALPQELRSVVENPL